MEKGLKGGWGLVNAEITRREALRRVGMGSTALALPALLGGCFGDDDDGGSAQGTGGAGTNAEIDSVTWSIGAAPTTLDLAAGFTSNGLLAMVLGLEGLVTYDDDLQLKPLLAKSWSQPDPLSYVYELRPGVKFWDGTPLTAEDVAYSLNRHLDPKVASQAAAYYASVKAIEVTGDQQVTVRMKQPDQLFQYVPVFSHVIPKAVGERLGKRLGTPGAAVNIMGTGPYRITKFSADSGITVERNPDYWGPKPRVRRATLSFIENAQTNLLAMRSGEIDGYFELPAQQSKDWERIPNVVTQYTPGIRIYYLSFDMAAPPWNDIHVRRAVAHACDRAGFVKAFLGERARPATSLVAPEQWGGVASPAEVEDIYAQIPQYDFDLEKAKEELAQSAHADGFTAEIDYPNTDDSVGKALVSLSETLKQLGITLRVNEITRDKWVAGIYAHKDLGLHFVTLGPDYADPGNFPSITFPSANAVENNFNTANFKNPEVDRLVALQSRTPDNAERARAIGEALKIAGEELPYLPLWWPDSSLAVRDEYVYPGFNSLYYYQAWLTKLRARA